MNITTRAVAKARGETVYFTGQPCKHGHTTYRYVNSGACSQCVKEANGQTADPLSAQRRAAKLEMVRVNFRAFVEDRATLASAVYAAALMRWPFLQEIDVDPRLLPTDRSGGTALYAFHCHEDDMKMLKGLCDTLGGAHLSQVTVDMERQIARNLSYLPPDTTPPMSFK